MATTLQFGEKVEDIARLLQPYMQSGNINFLIGSGASTPAVPLAGKIENEIDKLLHEQKDQEANLTALKFVEAISDKHLSIKMGIPDAPTEQVLSDYAAFLRAVDRILFERKNTLLPRQANVFTTNYDLLIEHAANSVATLLLNDGFDRSTRLTSDFIFAPERYFDRTYRSGNVYSHLSELPTINVIKLHGSLSWRKTESAIALASALPEMLADADHAKPDVVADRLKEYFLVLPNLRKFHTAMMDRVYYDLLRIYANSMDKENAVVLSFGFSFNDEHILDITRRGLRNPTSQLLVFSHLPEEAIGFAEKFDRQRNVMIIAPPERQKLTFGDLNLLLKSITPA